MPLAYIPADRLQALARGQTLPDRTYGAALFADISGFTPLTEALARLMGPQRGAEELTLHLNRVYDALTFELHCFGGSVVSFSGDAITCWFDGDDGLRALTCACSMQAAMQNFITVTVAPGNDISLALKAAVSTGVARRFLAGDPGIQLIDVIAGTVIAELSAAEHLALKGEVVLAPSAMASLGHNVDLTELRLDEASGEHIGVVGGIHIRAAPSPWPALPANGLSDDAIRPWLLPPVYERLHSGQGEFLAELRPAVALFLHFGGLDYDADESASQKLDAYVRQVQNTLARYEGALLQLSIGEKGDYMYAAFGAPLAHEDDAVRAAAAALDLRAQDCSFNLTQPVQIGISLGRMRTGAYGGIMRRTYGVLGDDVNLAARLMQAAQPGQILANRATHQASATAFRWEALPEIYVKGKAEPVAVFSLAERATRYTNRLQEPKYALPMVGRTDELALAERMLALSIQGRGQLIGITGEAGMGKSRLVAEIIRLAQRHDLLGYQGECPSYGANTSYLAWHNIWLDFFGVNPDARLDEQIATLKRELKQADPQLAPRLPLLGAVLNLPIPDNDLTQTFDAKLRKTSLESLLVDYLRARVNPPDARPLLLVIEDCQWLDPLSQDLLEAIGRAAISLPVLIVLTYRPPELQEAAPLRVSRLPHFTEIRLCDFTPQESERLIHLKLAQLLASYVEPPHNLVERIVDRAQGNPFYIEELLNYLQDRGIDPRDARALQSLDLPSSLHSLILTRIDTLTEGQRTALRVASVIGRLFRAAALWGAYPQIGDAERVKADLNVLTRLELTIPDEAPELTYLFKHIVTQEVAYESLPFATRAFLHEHVGQYIERAFSETLDQYVDLLAYHYDRSQNDDKKREYLLKAGQAAQADYANAAAIDYYRRALPLLSTLEQVPIMLKLGNVLELVGQWTETCDLFMQALGISEQLNDQHAEAQCQVALGELSRKQGQYAEAVLWLDRARATFETLNNTAGLGQVLHYAGSLAAQQGDYEAARIHYKNSLAIRRQLGDEPNIASVLSNLGIVARYRGDYTTARALHEEGLAIRRQLGDRRAIAVSLNNLGNVALDQNDFAEARAHLEEAVALQRQVGDRAYIANALNNLGNVARAQNDHNTARILYLESLMTHRELGDRWAIAYVLEDIGCLAAAQGQATRAARLVGAAAALRKTIGAPRSPAEQAKLDRQLEPARHLLGELVWASALADAESLPPDKAVEEALD